MANQYHLDLERFSLERFRHILETGRLLPSESILIEEIDALVCELYGLTEEEVAIVEGRDH